MRLLHYFKAVRLQEGGVVRAVLDMCALLAQAGHGVTLATYDDADVPGAWRTGGPGLPRVVTLEPPARAAGLFSRAQLARFDDLLRGADVLHLHAVWTPSNAQVAARARALGTPYVVSVHGMLDDWSMAQKGLKKRVYLLLRGRRMLEGAARVHCTARAELDQARKHFPRGTGEVIPLVFDLAPFRTLPGPGAARARWPELDAGRPNLLFLSRVHYKKGIEHLVRAAARLRDADRACTVIVAGTGDESYQRSLEALTAELRLGDLVRFVGHVGGELKLSLFQAADLFVLPTSQENFGFALFESLACATPVVTTRGVDTWPELSASGGAALSDPDPARLAETIRGLLADRAALARMGEQGRAWVLEHLDSRRIAERFVGMYQQARGR